MTTEFILALDDPGASLEKVGGKGASLARLSNAGFPVPSGFHITTCAYRLFVESNQIMPDILNLHNRLEESDSAGIAAVSQGITERFEQGSIPEELIHAVRLAYRELPGTSPPVAVRSSATAEDLPEASFAGQQSTYLNVESESGLLEAIKKCWASLWTERAISYRQRRGIHPESIALAVVVQQMVPADAAGIVFTANPLDGTKDHMVINASWGLGEAVVGGLVTPDTITVEKSSRKILNYQVAEKKIQTTRKNGGTYEIPVPADLQLTPTLDKTQVADLAELGGKIEELYQMPMDIEWVLSGGEFSIVQARPITAMPDSELVVKDEWVLPDGAYVAMRNNIVELMVDPLTPLFKTLGLEAVNRSMGNLLSGFFGNQEVMPGQLIIPVNEYAYYNGSVRFGPMVKIILNTPAILRRMFSGAVERWTEDGRPDYLQTVDQWALRDWSRLPSSELLDAVDQLAEAAIDAYGSLVSGVIPAAWITEALFTLVYRLVRSKEDPPAPIFLMGFDSLPIRAEKSLFDIAQWVIQNESLTGYFNRSGALVISTDLTKHQAPAGVSDPVWQEWQTRFGDHLDTFGHTIYNLDFGNPVPADDPKPVLEALKLFVGGEGVNPYERQKASVERREKAVKSVTQRLRGYRLKAFEKYLERAQRYAPLREDGLADVGLSYPLLRQMLTELGRRFASAGLISEPQDIYWLEKEEVTRAAQSLDQNKPLADLSPEIVKRKTIYQSASRVAPPMMLPQLKIFGFDLMSLKAGRAKRGGVDSLKGVAASPGIITAHASVLNGPEDFSKMETGNILVASMTTPAWTPLFARAAGVVTDIGGPLSHGSIVAREYGIPAVLGTDSATSHIQDGQEITVDGDKGIVILVEPST